MASAILRTSGLRRPAMSVSGGTASSDPIRTPSSVPPYWSSKYPSAFVAGQRNPPPAVLQVRLQFRLIFSA